MEQDQYILDYKKRFNDGYLLAKHMPDLASKLKDAPKDLGNGFKAGIEQFEIEKGNQPLPSWLNKDRLSGLDKGGDTNKDLDKGDLEK